MHEIIYQPVSIARKGYEMARAYMKFLPKARAARDYDAVLINREATLIGPAIVERWVASFGKPLIYHIDDPLYIPYRSPSNGALSYLKCVGKVKSLCRMSAVVTANSPSHVAFARRFNTNVWEIPSVVDGEVYDGWRERHDQAAPVNVGWSGSPSTVPNLEVVRSPLRVIGDRDDARIRLIGAEDFGLPDVKHSGKRWDASTEIEDLRSLDIGLVPLPLTPWTPHKFYLKLVQYMALGIPPVATPLGANTNVIDDGRTGFLAHDDADWISALERLIEDSDLRAEVGQRAAQVARERYTLQANADRVIAAFRSAIA
ncbi:MAG TPA: glycosyltransferase [Solirubrobacteraceae bacterium]|nr:glycosyltransferase [Solirubrobacteraceae bacterium]